MVETALDTLRREVTETPAYLRLLREFAKQCLNNPVTKTEFYSNIHNIYLNQEDNQLEIHFFILDDKVLPAKIDVIEFILFLNECSISLKNKVSQ